METYQELKARHKKEVEALPLGFAFSGKQFEEMKAKLGVKDDSELYRLGDIGCFYRKVDSQLIHDTYARHIKECRDAIFTAQGVNKEYLESAFYYEMCNHEFAINWSGKDDVLEACNITKKDLQIPDVLTAWNAAKKRYYADAEKNDWF